MPCLCATLVGPVQFLAAVHVHVHAGAQVTPLIDLEWSITNRQQVSDPGAWLQGAAAVQYTWQDDGFSWEFEFAHELLQDVGMPALLLAVAGQDPSLMTWNMQVPAPLLQQSCSQGQGRFGRLHEASLHVVFLHVILQLLDDVLKGGCLMTWNRQVPLAVGQAAVNGAGMPHSATACSAAASLSSGSWMCMSASVSALAEASTAIGLHLLSSQHLLHLLHVRPEDETWSPVEVAD